MLNILSSSDRSSLPSNKISISSIKFQCELQLKETITCKYIQLDLLEKGVHLLNVPGKWQQFFMLIVCEMEKKNPLAPNIMR